MPTEPTYQNPKKDKKKLNSVSSYAKYTSLAFEMIGVMLGGVFGGKYLDHLFANKTPWFTLFLTIFSVFLAIYIAIKDFLQQK